MSARWITFWRFAIRHLMTGVMKTLRKRAKSFLNVLTCASTNRLFVIKVSNEVVYLNLPPLRKNLFWKVEVGKPLSFLNRVWLRPKPEPNAPICIFTKLSVAAAIPKTDNSVSSTCFLHLEVSKPVISKQGSIDPQGSTDRFLGVHYLCMYKLKTE